MKVILSCIIFFSTSLISYTAAAQDDPSAYKSGYITINNKGNAISQSKVEVLEFFSYGCPHCAVLDKPLNSWIGRQNCCIEFRRVHVFFGEKTAAMQRLYYTLKYMDREGNLRDKIFVDIHERHVQLNNLDDVLTYIEKSSIDKREFIKVYQSSSVDSEVEKATAIQKKIGIRSIPAVVVNQRYLTRTDFFEPSTQQVNTSWWAIFSSHAEPTRRPVAEIQKDMFKTLDFLVTAESTKNQGR